MSDDRLDNVEESGADRVVLRLLDGTEVDLAEPQGDVGKARLAIETLGLLPAELEPMTPRPELKRELMRRLGSGAGGGLAEFPDPEARRLARLERRSGWMLPIAAALALALVGVSVWQGRQITEQRRTIAELSSQLDRVADDGVLLARARGELSELRGRMAMMTRPGAEFCLLKPRGNVTTVHEGAHATMVVSPERDRWLLVVEGLAPCPQGRVYQLWFITDADPIRGATFDGDPTGGRLELTGGMEIPLTVRAITITMESDRDAVEPSDPVLFADQAMRLL